MSNRNKYQDFITYAFNQPKPNVAESLSKIMKVKVTNLKPSELDFKEWVSLFDLFLRQSDRQQNLVGDSFSKQLKQQESLEKINRTRVDKNWRKF